MNKFLCMNNLQNLNQEVENLNRPIMIEIEAVMKISLYEELIPIVLKLSKKRLK
jgi:hypothetical protein